MKQPVQDDSTKLVHMLHPWVEKILVEGNGNLLQCPCLGKSMDRGAWWATLAKCLPQLSACMRVHTQTHTHSYTLKVANCKNFSFHNLNGCKEVRPQEDQGPLLRLWNSEGEKEHFRIYRAFSKSCGVFSDFIPTCAFRKTCLCG